MNHFIKLCFITCFILISPVFAHIKNLASIHLENIALDNKTRHIIGEKIRLENPVIVYVSTTDHDSVMDFYNSQLKAKYPFIYHDESQPDLAVISQIPIDYLKVLSFGGNNYVIEAANQDLAYLIFDAHLPGMSLAQIETLKSYFTATNPYLNALMQGDFDLNLSFITSPWELCAKGAVEVSAEADTKGSKSVKTTGEISSNDYRTKGSAEIEYKENEKGEKEGRAKVSIRKEF